MIDVKEFEEIFNHELARGILLEINPNITSEEVDEIWERCQGNPWNAGILYKMIELAKQNGTT